MVSFWYAKAEATRSFDTPTEWGTTVPIHGKRDLGRGLLRQIMRDANLTKADLIE